MSKDINETVSGNRLGEETSLYLRQHADNPVHWHPWDATALKAARESGRPILLSIGYSACHWCHVMAHESFEDQATADVMNALYVNIKVDREERPDLDKLYQLCHQFLSGRGGGWPLTLFLDPVEQIPFFAGTYFPPAARYGMPSFRDVLVRARQWFDENPESARSQGERLKQAIESVQAPPETGMSQQVDFAAATNEISALNAAAGSALLSAFDSQYGGFGSAPKFPQAPTLELLAALCRASGPESGKLHHALEFSLERMALSGLRDHLDGGFFRYCVDHDWTIPHFEKMLYDNAQLLPLYAEAAARTENPILLGAAVGITDWMKDAMLQPDGGFAASIDADADGEEGGFHVWDRAEVRQLLGDSQFEEFARVYGLEGEANFEGKAWHLVQRASAGPDNDLLSEARQILLDARAQRIHPSLDDKRLTAWNALTASGLLRAGRALDRTDWIEAAQETIDFVRKKLWSDGELLAVFNHGRSRFSAYLDDYAFVLTALLESLRSNWRRDDLDFAIAIARALIARFEDKENGGFFFSAEDEAVPIARCLVTQDDATPAGYAIAIRGLNELGHLLGDSQLTESADRALARVLPLVSKSPIGFASATVALLHAASPVPQVVIAGPESGEASALKQAVQANFPVNCYLPDSVGAEQEGISASKPLPGLLAEFQDAKELTARVCLGMKCLPPVHSLEDLRKLLET